MQYRELVCDHVDHQGAWRDGKEALLLCGRRALRRRWLAGDSAYDQQDSCSNFLPEKPTFRP